MDFIHDPKQTQEVLSVLGRLGLGVLLAGIIGVERELSGRPAGVRTHMLVALGSMLFSEAGRAFGGDPARVAAQVVTGIGFLGAGTIMRMGAEVKGLTTAASVWATAAIAMSVSAGGTFAIVAVAATILALLTLAVVDNFERMILKRSHQRLLALQVDSKACLQQVIDYLSSKSMEVRSIQVVPTETGTELVLDVTPKNPAALSVAAEVPEVRSARWSS